jgi:hypothetical protein
VTIHIIERAIDIWLGQLPAKEGTTEILMGAMPMDDNRDPFAAALPQNDVAFEPNRVYVSQIELIERIQSERDLRVAKGDHLMILGMADPTRLDGLAILKVKKDLHVLWLRR